MVEQPLLAAENVQNGDGAHDVTEEVTMPMTSKPSVEVSQPDDDFQLDSEAKNPLLQQYAEDTRKDTESSETEGRSPLNEEEVEHNVPTSDESDDIKLLKKENLSANFSSNGCLKRRDNPSQSREILSSPTASRVTFGFGSLDIIMEHDKNKENQTKDMESDPYERPQKWGWAVVIASWIVLIPIVGTLSSFGTVVSSLTEEFNATKMEAGWIGSLAFSFTVGTCPFSTPLFTVYGARKVAIVGVLGATISMVVTSFTPVLYLMFLTYSAMLGTFANFVYNSAMNLTGQYFPNKHQALATCLASAGVSFGTLLINPFSNALVELVGWRNTFRILAGVIFVIGLICVSMFRPVKTRHQEVRTKVRHHKGKKGHEHETTTDALMHAKIGSLEKVQIEALAESLQNIPTESKMSLAAQEIKKTVLSKSVYDCSVCGNPAFILWMLGTLFWSVSFLFPFIFLIDYMKSVGIPRDMTAWVMTAYGVAEFLGRLLCALGAGKIPFSLAYVYAGSAFVVGAATLLAPFGKTLAIMYVYAVVAGINSGILNSLMFVATMQFFGNEKGRHVWGYINVMLAVGMVVGPVAAGGIFDATNSYVSAFYMGGSVFVLCAFVMMLIPIALNHFPQREHEETVIREKPCKDPMSTKSARNGSIVKPGALQQMAFRAIGKSSSKSKWNGEVHAHLQELGEIENEILTENRSNDSSKHVTICVTQADVARNETV